MIKVHRQPIRAHQLFYFVRIIPSGETRMLIHVGRPMLVPGSSACQCYKQPFLILVHGIFGLSLKVRCPANNEHKIAIDKSLQEQPNNSVFQNFKKWSSSQIHSKSNGIGAYSSQFISTIQRVKNDIEVKE